MSSEYGKIHLRPAAKCPWLCALVLLGLAAAFASAPAHAENGKPDVTQKSIGLTAFSFSDTSGEVRDQSAAHQARLQHFSSVLRAILEKTGHFRVISLPCPSDPCASTPAEGEDLLKAARQSGANFVVVGGIHKMSSLVIFMKADVYKVATDRPVFSRLYTFRGDNDDAWVRAAEFLARQIDSHS